MAQRPLVLQEVDDTKDKACEIRSVVVTNEYAVPRRRQLSYFVSACKWCNVIGMYCQNERIDMHLD